MDKVKVFCPSCGSINAYPLAAEDKKVVCGRCKKPLPRPGEVLEPDETGLRSVLSNGSLPVLVDFYSTTCMPCHLMHPIVARLAGRHRGELLVVKANVEVHPGLASQLQIRAVPTFVVFSKGYEMGRTSGAMSEADFSLWVANTARA
jgi:thioredoxin 2